MPSIYQLKPLFQQLLRPLCRYLVQWHITANQVTVSAVLLSLVTGVALAWQPSSWLFLLLPIILLIRMALNAIDGLLAREYAMQTPLGAILNELGDVIADAGLYLPFALLPGINSNLVVLVVLSAIVSEMTGVIAVQIGAERRYDGPFGKSDRAVAFGLISLLIGSGLTPGLWLNGLLIIMLVLSIITLINRAYRALEQVQQDV